LAGALGHVLDKVSGNPKASTVLAIKGKALVGLWVTVFDDELARHIL
jgi:hypothetical protein